MTQQRSVCPTCNGERAGYCDDCRPKKGVTMTDIEVRVKVDHIVESLSMRIEEGKWIIEVEEEELRKKITEALQDVRTEKA